MTDPGSPSLQTPADEATIYGNVLVFSFTVPTDADNNNLVFRLEMDTNAVISSGSGDYKLFESRFYEANKTHGIWTVDNGTGTFITIPSGGVISTYYENTAKVSIRKQDANDYPDSSTTWYWRIGVSDNLDTPAIFNQVTFGQVIFGS